MKYRSLSPACAVARAVVRAVAVALCLAVAPLALGAQSAAGSWIGKWLYSPPPGGDIISQRLTLSGSGVELTTIYDIGLAKTGGSDLEALKGDLAVSGQTMTWTFRQSKDHASDPWAALDRPQVQQGIAWKMKGGLLVLDFKQVSGYRDTRTFVPADALWKGTWSRVFPSSGAVDTIWPQAFGRYGGDRLLRPVGRLRRQ